MFVYLLFAVPGFLALLGVVFVVRSRRGRRLDDHRVCARCRYDLHGLPADAAQCPECGANLGRRRAIRIGNRATHGRRLAVGALMFLVGLSGAAYLGLTSKRGYNWNRHAPMPMLLHDAFDSNSPRRSRSAAYVFYDRHHAGSLSKSDYTRIIDALLDYQADPTRPWDFFWGDLIEILRHAGHVTDDQWRRFITQMYAWELVGEPTVRPWGRWRYEFKMLGAPRGASPRRHAHDYLIGFSFEDEHDMVFAIKGTTDSNEVVNKELVFSWLGDHYPAVARINGQARARPLSLYMPQDKYPPGRYSCTVTLRWYVYDTVHGIPYSWNSGLGNWGGPVELTSPVTYTTTFEVVEP